MLIIYVPSNLEIGETETIFISEKDKFVNKSDIKRIGEVTGAVVSVFSMRPASVSEICR